MNRRLLGVLCVLLLAVAACGDDDNGGSSSNGNGDDNGGQSQDANALGVVAENTGSGDFDPNGVGSALYCYADSGCEEVGGESFNTVFEGQEMDIANTEPGREAVGLEITFTIAEGTGILHVVDGRSYEDDGWPEFDVGEILDSSDELEAGDTHTITWGDVDS